MKITTNKFNIMDIVRYRSTYCQVVDIIVKKDKNEWFYDLREVFASGEHLDVPESHIRDLTFKQSTDYYKKYYS